MRCLRLGTWAAALGLSLIAAHAGHAQAVASPSEIETKLPPGYVKEFGTMWTFEAPPFDYWKARYGFTPTKAWLDHVRLASVRLPNCSASFVSARGLVMTNHHCARECITAVSTPDSNFQEVGFVAKTQADERKCPGLYVDQLQSIEDVTGKVQSAVTATSPRQQVAQREAAKDALEKECENEPDTVCQVITYYQGGIYSLYHFKRFSDLRLVMAPEEAISFFGGDPDNFTYPRYDLDLSLMRVYENDQPYQPKDYLKWSKDGREGGRSGPRHRQPRLDRPAAHRLADGIPARRAVPGPAQLLRPEPRDAPGAVAEGRRDPARAGERHLQPGELEEGGDRLPLRPPGFLAHGQEAGLRARLPQAHRPRSQDAGQVRRRPSPRSRRR